MRNIHIFTPMRRAQKWLGRMLRAFASVRKQLADKEAGRQSILSISAHLQRDAGLDKIPDDP
ncbi:hypothetical protein GGD50_001893 [Rhizobium paranaense]|uniref:DUF1127 domain-containing protein n=1 Tax=Rhizobium paranaense TaxID=1650438 RepID=A0A7W8XPN2_9HYPH|nr:hypothetical protein [Rhizobium paranaense]PST62361.1 hypothetical protein C9E91_12410 [Rhizobium sp. SEMIA4064]